MSATDEWNDRLLYLLVTRHDMALPTAEEVVAECAAHCAETGEDPGEAFGPPETFAARSAAERTPVLQQAARDRDGITPGEYLWGSVLRLGIWLTVAAVLLWVMEGGRLGLTVAGVTGCVLLAVALLLSGLVRDLYRAGRLRAARLAVAGVVLLVPATAAAFMGLSRARVATVPTAALLAAGLVVLVAAWRFDPPRWPAVPVRMRPGRDADEEREQWLSRLGGIMRGRHEWSRGRADRLVAEARAHLAATGRRPEEEFGPVDVYALRSAEQVRTPRLWWRRRVTGAAVTAAALLVYLVLRITDGDFGAMFVLNAVVLGVVAFDLCRQLVRGNPAG